jgi:hypothetical protein
VQIHVVEMPEAADVVEILGAVDVDNPQTFVPLLHDAEYPGPSQ